jgi:hypothetical protein
MQFRGGSYLYAAEQKIPVVIRERAYKNIKDFINSLPVRAHHGKLPAAFPKYEYNIAVIRVNAAVDAVSTVYVRVFRSVCSLLLIYARSRAPVRARGRRSPVRGF